MIWTEAMTGRMVGLAREPNLSARDIARAMSAEFGVEITRSAICGALRRAGIALPAKQRRARAVEAKIAFRLGLPCRPKPVAAPPPAISLIDAVRLEDRSPLQCPFPLWAHAARSGGPDFFVCGGAKDVAAEYCARHSGLTRGKPPKSPSSTEVLGGGHGIGGGRGLRKEWA